MSSLVVKVAACASSSTDQLEIQSFQRYAACWFDLGSRVYEIKREDRYIHEGKPSLPFTASTEQAVAAAQAFIPEPPGREKHKL